MNGLPVVSNYFALALIALFTSFFVTSQVALAQDPVEQAGTAEVQTFSGLDAATDTVYFSLADKEIVGADSDWDLAFKGTTILVNGEAMMVEKAFKKVAEAPSDGYKVDKPGTPAIPTGNQEGWFDYDPSSHQVTPMAFRTIVIKLSRGGYAKMEIVDYYAADGTPRSYTFRYALSETGTF
jgi:hypothetical protein